MAVVVGMISEAKIIDAPQSVVIGGGRSSRVASELEALSAKAPLRAVLSFGVAGALDPKLRAGDLLLADEVVSLVPTSPDCGQTGRIAHFHCDAGLLADLRSKLNGAKSGALFGAERAIASPADKTALHKATGAVAVDMESLAAAQFAARRNLPFIVLRAIADPASRTLPSCALVGLRPDGSTDALAVLRALLTTPSEAPALIRVAHETGLALKALAVARRQLTGYF